MRQHTPSEIAKPIGAYSHAVEVEEGARTVYVSGQVGMAPDGTVPETCDAQSELVWSNIRAILAAAGMTVEDIVKMTAYLLSPEDAPSYGATRARYLGDHRPASTLLFVSALVRPELKVEVEVVAAKR